MKILAIIGAGHLGQQIAHYAITDKHYDSVVFFDDVLTVKNILGYDILGNSDDVLKAFSAGKFTHLMIGIGYNHLAVRSAIFDRFNGQIPFGSVVHSTVYVDPTAIIQPGCMIYPGCIIDARAIISENILIHLNSITGHDSIIGRHCFISACVAIAGFVKIGEGCFVGIGATIIDSTEIITKTQIGAGTVVTKSIEKPGLYVGNPHRFIR